VAYVGDSFTVVQSVVGCSPPWSLSSVYWAACWTACHRLRAHPLPACEVNECSNPAGSMGRGDDATDDMRCVDKVPATLTGRPRAFVKEDSDYLYSSFGIFEAQAAGPL